MVSSPIPGDIPMFEAPERYRKPTKADPDKVTWGAHRGKRETCGLCTLDIRDGLLQHPLALASKVYKKGGAVWYLCSSHAHEVKRGSRRVPE